MAVERFKTNVNICLILEKDEKILLSLRKNTGYKDGEWGLLAGSVEAGESCTAAACREALEEVGIIIDPKNLVLLHVMHCLEDRENLDMFFFCNEWDGEIRNCEPEKCGGLEFFDFDNMPEKTINYLRNLFDLLAVEALYSESGWEKIVRQPGIAEQISI